MRASAGPIASGDPPEPPRRPPGLDEHAARRAATAFAALALGVAAAYVFVAATVPYHSTDGLLFGRWSRLIGQDGGFEHPGLLTGYYHRPLFYVLQGWMWHAFGFSEWSGRLLSLTFGLLLGFALAGLARTASGWRRGPAVLAGGAAVAVLIATPDAIRDAAGGQTDVPAAALLALCGWLAWRRPQGPLAVAGLVAAAAAAGLSKPSAFPGLAGLALAILVADGRRGASRRLGPLAAIGAGTALALVYAIWESHRLGFGLADFLRGANGDAGSALDRAAVDYFGAVNGQMRRSVVLGFEWLGPYLVVPLTYAIAYAAVRGAGRRHRRSADWALGCALVGSVALPLAAQSATTAEVGPWHADRPVALLASLAFLAGLWFVRDASPRAQPGVVAVRRLAIWMAVPLAAWVVISPSTTRYLSPAWPALLVLMGMLLAAALDGLGSRRPLWAAALVGAVLAVAVADLRNLDGLGTARDGSISSLRAVRELGVAGWFDRARARRAADPGLAALLDATRSAMRPGDVLVTSDSRLGFYFPGRVRHVVARSCRDLRGADVFVLMLRISDQLDAGGRRRLDPAVRRLVYRADLRDPRRWERCADPRLRLSGEVPGVFRVYRLQQRG